MIDLQCSVNFYCTAKWPSHTCIYILFLTLSCIMFHCKWLDISFPMLYSMISLPVHSKCKSFHLLTPDFQSIPLPPLRLWQTQVCPTCPWSFLFCRYISPILLSWSQHLFIFLNGFLCCAEDLSLIRSHWVICVFIVFILGGGLNTMLLWFMSTSILSVFLYKF